MNEGTNELRKKRNPQMKLRAGQTVPDFEAKGLTFCFVDLIFFSSTRFASGRPGRIFGRKKDQRSRQEAFPIHRVIQSNHSSDN